MSLQYSYLDPTEPSGVPARAVNGGLYIGEPAAGEWGNVPIVPEAHVMIDAAYTRGERTPPTGMKYQAVSTTRPGNNAVQFPHHQMCTTMNFNSLCRKD